MASPVFVVSIVVLVLNDHVLKSVWPGTVTGKLSDVAGVAMVAIASTALLRSRALGLSSTVAAFALLKTVPLVAVWAVPALGGRTRTDPTDLVALLVLLPLWWWLGSPSSEPVRRGAWVLPVQVVAVCSAVLATTATSCAPSGIGSLDVVDGVVVATGEDGEVFVSDDAGLTWSESSGGVAVAADVDDHCDGSRCVDVRWMPGPSGDREIVLVEPDGREQVVFRLTADGADRLDRAIRPACGGEGYLHDAVVVATEDGPVLLFSLGEGGVLRRDATGEWQSVAVGDFSVDVGFETAGDDVTVLSSSIDAATDWGRAIATAVPVVLVGVLWAVASSIASVRRRNLRATRPVWIATAVSSAVLGLPALLFAQWTADPFGLFVYVVWMMLTFVTFVVIVVVLAATSGSRRETLPPPPPWGRLG